MNICFVFEYNFSSDISSENVGELKTCIRWQCRFEISKSQLEVYFLERVLFVKSLKKLTSAIWSKY